MTAKKAVKNTTQVHRPACPVCEGAGHSHALMPGVRLGLDLASGGSRSYRVLVRVQFTCPYCGGVGRVHPDTLDSYIRNNPVGTGG